MDKKVTIESEEFYNLMQSYRHTPIVPVHVPGEKYREVISHIDERLNELVEAASVLADEFQEMAELMAMIGNLPASVGRDNAALVDMRTALKKARGE